MPKAIPATMQPQQRQKLTSEIVQQGILGMKKALSQIEGECNTMRIDAQSKIFENMANICGQLLQERENNERMIKSMGDKIEKIYQAHPEFKMPEDIKGTGKTQEIIVETASPAKSRK